MQETKMLNRQAAKNVLRLQNVLCVKLIIPWSTVIIRSVSLDYILCHYKFFPLLSFFCFLFIVSFPFLPFLLDIFILGLSLDCLTAHTFKQQQQIVHVNDRTGSVLVVSVCKRLPDTSRREASSSSAVEWELCFSTQRCNLKCRITVMCCFFLNLMFLILFVYLYKSSR